MTFAAEADVTGGKIQFSVVILWKTSVAKVTFLVWQWRLPCMFVCVGQIYLKFLLLLLLPRIRFLGLIDWSGVVPGRAVARRRWWRWRRRRRWWDGRCISNRLTRHRIETKPTDESLTVLLYTFIVQSSSLVWVGSAKETSFRTGDILWRIPVVVEGTTPWSRCRCRQETVWAGYLTGRHFATMIFNTVLIQ